MDVVVARAGEAPRIGAPLPRDLGNFT